MQQQLIPKTQKASVYYSHGGKVSVQEIPVPEIGSDDILVKVLYTGICHTDVHTWLGELPLKSKEFPIVSGHEGAGIVVKLGENVKNFKLGDRAGIQWINSTCYECEFCKKGLVQNCINCLMSGFTADGSFQQYAVMKAKNSAHIPEEVDMASVAPILCAGVTVYVALRDSGVQSNEIVAITGAGGGLGSLCIQYARAMKFQVLAIDTGDKEEHCRKMGAQFFIDVLKSKDIVEDVRKLTNGGPHGVINLATSVKAMNAAAKYVRTRGTVVLIAIPKDDDIQLDVFETITRSITIKGSYVGNPADVEKAIEYFVKGHINVPIKIQPLSAVEDVFKQMLAGKITGRVVIDLWK